MDMSEFKGILEERIESIEKRSGENRGGLMASKYSVGSLMDRIGW